MASVFIVEPDDYPEDVDIMGVYSTETKAEEAAEEFNRKDPYRRRYNVTEWEVE